MKVYEKRIVAFIDLLGFKSLIYESKVVENKRYVITSTLNFFKKFELPDNWKTELIEIEEDAQKKDLDKFDISEFTNCTCFSDSIVVSVKINDDNINEALSTMVANLSYIGLQLFMNNVLLRGAITIGDLNHDSNGVVFGEGLIDAYNLESNVAIYPRIILSDKLLGQLNYPLLSKRGRYPYHQYLERHEDGCVGFHQMIALQVLSGSTIFSDEDIRNYVIASKDTILRGLDKSIEKPSVFKKYNWLRKKFDNLLISDCDGEDIQCKIYTPSNGDSKQNIHYSYINDFYDRTNQK